VFAQDIHKRYTSFKQSLVGGVFGWAPGKEATMAFEMTDFETIYLFLFAIYLLAALKNDNTQE